MKVSLYLLPATAVAMLSACGGGGGGGGANNTPATPTTSPYVSCQAGACTWNLPAGYVMTANDMSILERQLGNNPVTVNIESGDLQLASPIASDSPQTLTIHVPGDLHVDAPLTLSNSQAKLILQYGQAEPTYHNPADYYLTAPINLPAGPSFSTCLGHDCDPVDYTVITELGQPSDATSAPAIMTLQGIGTALHSHYALGANIDAHVTASWNLGDHDEDPGTAEQLMGFTPHGSYLPGNYPDQEREDASFTGNFEGLGHTISGLFVNRQGSGDAGLFGSVKSGKLRNVGMLDVSITGDRSAGGLTGFYWGDESGLYRLTNQQRISHCYTTGTVKSRAYAGGLSGYFAAGILENSFSSATVEAGNTDGDTIAGGVTGRLTDYAILRNTYATGSITTTAEWASTGGLVGSGRSSKIQNSFSTGKVTGEGGLGGLMGISSNVDQENSFWATDSSGQATSSSYGDTSASGKLLIELLASDVLDALNSGSVEPRWTNHDSTTTPMLLGGPGSVYLRSEIEADASTAVAYLQIFTD